MVERLSGILPLICALGVVASCSSVKPGAEAGSAVRHDTSKTASPKSASPQPIYAPNLQLVFSASGFGTKPADAFNVDSDRSMSVEVRTRQPDGTWKALSGLAFLEPEDYDTMVRLVTAGELLDIDPTDLTGNCSDGEYFTLSFKTSNRPTALHLDYSQCKLVYNLLTEPKRSGFLRFNEWLERMRIKYRPARPEY